jgi:hypothetical protein
MNTSVNHPVNAGAKNETPREYLPVSDDERSTLSSFGAGLVVTLVLGACVLLIRVLLG